MEGLFIELARSLAAQGAAYTLLVIVGAALAYTVHRWIKAENKCFELSTTLNEKRITERSETIAILHAGTQASLKLAESISVRTETLNNLIVVVTAGNERLERQLAEALKILNNMIMAGAPRNERLELLLVEVSRRIEDNKEILKEGRRVAAD